jgi:hypothetical protein
VILHISGDPGDLALRQQTIAKQSELRPSRTVETLPGICAGIASARQPRLDQ